VSHRGLLESLFREAVNAVDGRPCVRRALEFAPLSGDLSLLAMGKAADGMVRGAMDLLGPQIKDGLVITRRGSLSAILAQDERLRCLQSSHPIPDAASLEAGKALLDFLDELPTGRPLLALVSGGASSLVEWLPDGFGESHLRELNEWLLSRHMDIAAVNAVRRSVSLVKGGRLALRLRGRPVRLLLISDVPGDDPGVIGSGMLTAAPAPRPLPDGVPDWVRLAAASIPDAPGPGDPVFASISGEIVASNARAREAVVDAASRRDLRVLNHRELLRGDALAAGEMVARTLIDGPPSLHVWGGETTVSLPPEPGRGGRAQALALAAAMVLEGQERVWLLAAGTDGLDGPGEDAGAVVDTQTVFRGRQAGLAPDDCLEAADSGTFLDASGDLLRTGPTGTNVMDIVIGLKE